MKTEGLTPNDQEYYNIHLYIRRRYPKTKKCSICKTQTSRAYHWALISGKTYSKDITDYIELCARCHANYDKGNYEILEGVIIISPPKRVVNVGSGGSEHCTSKAIYKKDLSGNIIKSYGSLTEALKDGYLVGTISECLRGNKKTAYGFKWEFQQKKLKHIICTEPNGNEIIFNSLSQAARELNLDLGFLGKVANGLYKQYKRYKFKIQHHEV